MREEGLGTGVEREVNRGLVKFKMADEIVGVKVPVIGIFTPTIKLLLSSLAFDKYELLNRQICGSVPQTCTSSCLSLQRLRTMQLAMFNILW